MFCSVSDSFTLDIINGLSYEYSLSLKDNFTEEVKNISEIDQYKFYYNVGDDSTRFTLIFTKNIITGTTPDVISNNELNIKAVADNGFIKISNPEKYEVSLYNIKGEVFSNSDATETNIKVNQGVYLLKAVSAKGTYSNKIFVK